MMEFILYLISIKIVTNCKKIVSIKKTKLSSIVNEAIRTIYLFFSKDILLKKTHKLCSNISIRLKSIIKHTSNFHSDIRPKSIIKHTSNFHLDIAPRNIKKKFRLNIFIRLKKHTSNFHSDITSRSIKNKQLFI